MMNKKEMTQFAKRILHSQQGLKNHQLMHPRREWFVGVGVALSIFVVSGGWSALNYFHYQTIEQTTVSAQEAAPPVYRESLVTEALTAFINKEQRLNNLLGEKAVPASDAEVTEEGILLQATSTESVATSSESIPTEEVVDQSAEPAPAAEESNMAPTAAEAEPDDVSAATAL